MTSKEALEIINKDLLILELLRKYVYFDKKDNLIKITPINDQMENFDFEIIKEWLEND